MDKLKAGIIGCGAYGDNHARIIRHLGHFELRAFADVNLEAAESFLAEFGGAYCDADYMRVLSDPEIDVVYICTTHDAHHPIAMEAIRRGKHVFLEKPMCMTVEQCEDIVGALENSPLKLAVGHKMRYAPHTQKAKQAIPKPISIVAQMMCERWADDMWPQDPVKGGGNVFSQGCHIFDLAAYLAGAEPERVYAEGGAFTHPGWDQLDSVAATVRYKNGVIASISVGDAGQNGFTSKTMVQIYGGNDCVNLSNRLLRYDRYRGQDAERSELPDDLLDPVNDPEGLYRQEREFYDCIAHDRQPLVGAKEGMNAVRMVRAAFRSAREGTAQYL
ncbi:MAG: Gfo/Idh/MocA family oxidoreductase [Defluviitaleaceae bacterium]|nr:Gfo/Idh/MocA family oxidoreductase [Defluviitaleaceae bacterium]